MEETFGDRLDVCFVIDENMADFKRSDINPNSVFYCDTNIRIARYGKLTVQVVYRKDTVEQGNEDSGTSCDDDDDDDEDDDDKDSQEFSDESEESDQKAQSSSEQEIETESDQEDYYKASKKRRRI